MNAEGAELTFLKEYVQMTNESLKKCSASFIIRDTLGQRPHGMLLASHGCGNVTLILPSGSLQSLRSCTGSTQGHSIWTGSSRACSSWTGSRMTHSSWTGRSRVCSSWTGSRMTHSLRMSSRAYSSWIGSRMTHNLRRSSRACSNCTGSSHKKHSLPWSPHRSHSPLWSPHRSHSPPWSPHKSHSWSRNRLAHSSTRACSSRWAHSSWSHSPQSRSHTPHSRSHSPHSWSHSLQSRHSSAWFWWIEGGAGRGAGEREVQVWSPLSLGSLYPCPG
nr:CLK4-associating serine/arginine rich protein-like [Pongo pygmaeus]